MNDFAKETENGSSVISLEESSFEQIRIKLWAISKFIISRKIYFAAILISAVILVLFVGGQPSMLWKNLVTEIKNNNTGAIFNLVTLVFILALWIANTVSEWKQTLDKYLSVKFFCKDCDLSNLNDEYALLISEEDIRSLAQQIGRQKNNNKHLDLDSTKYTFKKTLSYDKDKQVCKAPFWHYDVKVTLRSPPE